MSQANLENLENYYENHVVASVTFGSTGYAEPVDRPSSRALQKAELYTNRCFVRDINQHETIEVKLHVGTWRKAVDESFEKIAI